MTRGRKSRSGDEISFRPKFRGRKREGKGAEKRFLKRVSGSLSKSLRKGGRRLRRYSHGRGRVHKLSHPKVQRVVVKSRVVRNKGESLKKHFLYVERRGAGIDGEKGKLFSEMGFVSDLEKENWLKDAEGDRHHFRLIVSPERATELDLEKFARDFAAGLENDLETRLRWLSVVHTNTDNPHVHFIIRGVTAEGSDLVINREYISNGMRTLASTLATKELGYRRDVDVKQDAQKSIVSERFTWVDRKLLESGEVIDCREQTFRKVLLVGRLQFLKGQELATETDVGIWRVDPSLEEKLQALGKRGDIIKTMHDIAGQKTYPATLEEGETARGVVLGSAVVDELSGEKQVVVECDDGKLRSVVLAEGRGADIRKSSTVKITRSTTPERGAFRGRLFGTSGAWVNLNIEDNKERVRQVVRAVSELEREEELSRKQALRIQMSERLRSQFLKRLREKGREK